VTFDKNTSSAQYDQLNPTVEAFSVNGSQGGFNTFYLDGVEFKDYVSGTNPFSPNIDAIQEFNAASSNYGADMGQEAAAQVNMVMKSGGNQVHGDAYEFLRNDKLDARNFFAAQRPPFRRNQFGATIGGPIVLPGYNGKDKTFFFGAYEGFRHRMQVPTLENFPTPAQLAGDLSTLVTPGTPLINPYTGQPFATDQIPANMMPSTLEPWLQTGGLNGTPWIPAPNSTIPGLDYLYNVPQRFNYDQVMTRIDHRIGNQTFLFGHYVYEYDNGDDITAWPGPGVDPNWHILQHRRSHNVAFHIARPIKSNFLFEFNFGYSKMYTDGVQSTANKDNICKALGFVSGCATAAETWGAPIFSVSGYTNLGMDSIGPRQWLPDIFQFRPAFSLIKGKHTMKFGGEFYRFLETFRLVVNPAPVYYNSGVFTNYPLADFLLGLPASVFISPLYTNPLWRYSLLSGYFQDDWKITPHLTLNLGMRYEWMGAPKSSNKTFEEMYFAPNNVPPISVLSDGAQPLTYNGVQQTLMPGVPYIYASKIGWPEALAFPDDKDLGPRVGFAYTIPGLRNTVMRAGYGIFYQRDSDNKWNDSSLNPPLVWTESYTLNSSNFQSFNWFDPAHLGTETPLGYFLNDPYIRNGRTAMWNFSLEHTVWNTLFSAAYVGNSSWHLPNQEYPNQARPGPGSIVSRERWPGSGDIVMFTYDSNANYHSLQLKVQRPLAKGLQMLIGYTFSKDIDDSGGTYIGEGAEGFQVQDSYNRHADRGLADQDIRNRFVLSYIYQLPFGRTKHWLNQGGVGSALLSNWQINGITTFGSGSPVGITQACNRANTNQGSMRPDLVGNPNDLPSGRSRGQKVAEWFDTSAFLNYCPGPNGPFNFGNAGWNIVTGPGTNNWDFSLYRSFPIKGESKRVEFRAEFFNLFNHPDFGQPGSTAGTPTFGEISSTNFDNREIQFGLKLYF
jgi:hypothetical protein